MSQPQNRRTQSSESGFTLVEILVAILIVGVLASIAIPLFINQYNRGATTELETSLLRSQMYLQEKKTENSGMYPRDFAQEELAFPKGTNVKYTFNAERTEYCLQGTNSRGTTRYVTSTKSGVSTDACTYSSTSTSATKPVLSASMVTDGTYQLTWNHSSEDGNYKVYKDGVLLKTISGSTQYHSTEPLNTVSKFHIVAGGQQSNVVTLIPHAPAPKTAPLLSIMDTNGDKVEWRGMLNWTSVANATSYLVYDNKGIELTNGGTKENRFAVATKIGTTRTFYVVAVNDLGKSPKSSIVTLQGPIPGGNVLKATPTYNTEGISLTFTWAPQDSKVNGSSKYNFYQDGSLNTTTTAKTATVNLNYDTGVKKFQVKGVGQNGVEGFDSNIITFDTTVPNLPKPTIADSGIEKAGTKYAPWVRVNNYTSEQYPSWAFSHWKAKYAVDGGTQYETASGFGSEVSGGWEATFSTNPGETLRVYIVAVDILGRESPASNPVELKAGVNPPVLRSDVGRSTASSNTSPANDVVTLSFSAEAICDEGSSPTLTVFYRQLGQTAWKSKSSSAPAGYMIYGWNVSASETYTVPYNQQDRRGYAYYATSVCTSYDGTGSSNLVRTETQYTGYTEGYI